MNACSSCEKNRENMVAAPEGAYLGQVPPAAHPELYGPKLISGNLYDRDMTFSPDLGEFYYTMTDAKRSYQAILFMKQSGKFWGMPTVASFSGQYPDMEPMFTPDGKSIYFCSKRPIDPNLGIAEDNWNIWRVDRNANGWDVPYPINAVNTSKNEFYPCVTNDGTLYFTAQYEEGKKEDIYSSEFTNGTYQVPEALGASINTRLHEFNAFVAPDKSFMVFSSFGRNDDMGGGDLYISHADENGLWQPAYNPGAFLNSDALDYSPYVTADGEFLFFTSERSDMEWTNPSYSRDREELIAMFENIYNGQGNIFWVKAGNIKGPDSTNVSVVPVTVSIDSLVVDTIAIDTIP